jgi:hypothetical protein
MMVTQQAMTELRLEDAFDAHMKRSYTDADQGKNACWNGTS